MFAAGALAFATAVEIALVEPPHRSTRPARRNGEGHGGIRRAIREIRATLAAAADQIEDGLPTLRSYPY